MTIAQYAQKVIGQKAEEMNKEMVAWMKRNDANFLKVTTNQKEMEIYLQMICAKIGLDVETIKANIEHEKGKW